MRQFLRETSQSHLCPIRYVIVRANNGISCGGHLCCDVDSQSKAKYDGADDAVTASEENSK